MYKFVFVFVFCIIISTTLSQKLTCAESKAAFKIDCDRYGGVTVGGRCFFSNNETSNWTDGWTSCAKFGNQVGRKATLAQIHTTNEFNKVAALMSKFGGTQVAWLALRRDSGYTFAGVCGESFIPDQTWWYSDANSPDEKLVIANTWVWAAAALAHFDVDNEESQANSNCFCLYPEIPRDGVPATIVNAIGNFDCNGLLYSVCQFDNNCNYYLHKKDICFKSQTYATFVANGFQDCSKECTKTPPCRGFNLYADGRCELVTWDADPNYPAVLTYQRTPECGYNRVPNMPTFEYDSECTFYESSDTDSCDTV